MNAHTDSGGCRQTGIRQLLTPDQLAALNSRKDLPGAVYFPGHQTFMCATGTLLYL
jgi:hypothetical protein